MKVKLTVYDTPDKGYLTLDPHPMDGPAFTGNMSTLEGVAEPAEVTELLADTFLDFVPANRLEDTIKSWCGLLRHGGKIILGGTNANDLARLWVTKSITPEAFNQAVYGHTVGKRGLHSIERVEEILTGLGIKIVRKSLPGNRFVIEGVRP